MASATHSGERGLLSQSWVGWAALAAATILGAALRVHGLGSPSFWVDEFFTIGRMGPDDHHWSRALGYLPSHLSLALSGAQIDRIHLDNVTEWPALGVTETAARLGPCWVGIVTIPLLGLLARPVLGGSVAGLSALLLAITPWHLYWSQMARFYTAQFLFANVFLLALLAGAGGRRLGWFAAAPAALLAYLFHPTAVFLVGCAVLGAAVRSPRRWGLVLGLVGVAGLALLFSGIEGFRAVSRQGWDPSLFTLVVGTVLRIEPLVLVAGIAFAGIAVRRRDAVAITTTSVAIGVPLCLLLIKPFFPIAPRYYLSSLYAWTLLAAGGVLELDRRLGSRVGAAGLGVLLLAVGANAWLYAADGAGARLRWREAFTYVREHGRPDDPVVASTGRFQALYYLGRPAITERPGAEALGRLQPGTWLLHRSRGSVPEAYHERLERRARFEIPSRPWSWVLHVLRVPDPASEDGYPSRAGSGPGGAWRGRS